MKTRYSNDKGKIIERTLTDHGFIFDRQIEEPASWQLNNARYEINVLNKLFRDDKQLKNIVKPRV